jgi:hypothetical protein
MDPNVALMSTGTGGTLLMVALYLYKSMAGKKIRSRCCEKDVEMGFSVEDMTPPQDRFRVNNPMGETPVQSVLPQRQSSKTETTA